LRRFWATAAIALATASALGIQTALVARTGFPLGDFRAFYCAAQIAAHGANPYHTEPLRSCEEINGLGAFFKQHPGVTVPAPLPGYAVGALVPLAMLPPAVAAAVWFAMLMLACALGVLSLARFAAVAWPVPVSAFAFSLGVASLPFGEIVPIAIAAICVCAYFAWRGNWQRAAIAGAVAMIEPHLGLPVCLALSIWAPATRLSLGVSFAVLASMSLLTFGPATNLEYFASVLPAHALSEAGRDTQYSLTSVLASVGVTYGIAARAGLLSYLAMLALGTAIAGWLAKKTQNAAFLACVPPAFAVFGGTFIHVTQIAAALPAAILFLKYAGTQRRALVAIALLLLSVPWIMAWSPVFGLVPAFPIGYLVWSFWHDNVRAVLLAVVLAGGLVVGMNRALLLMATHPFPTHVVSTIDPDLPEASWSEFSTRSSNGTAGAWLVRIPTWGGLALLLGLMIGGTKRVRFRLAPRAES